MTALQLTAKQQARVRQFIEEDWLNPADDDSRTGGKLQSLLSEVLSPLELDEMVRCYNWDNGPDSLLAVLAHPLIQPATVLRAFWMSCPGYYCQYASEAEVPDFEKPALRIVKVLAASLREHIGRPSLLGFNPADDDGIDWTSEYLDEEAALVGSEQVSPFSIDPRFRVAIRVAGD